MRRVSAAGLVVAFGAALLATACNDTVTPTEVPKPLPTRTWNGTFTGVSFKCNSSASAQFMGAALPTQMVVGCLGGGIDVTLSRQGNTLTGSAYFGDSGCPITGTLTDTAMDFTIFNDTVDFPDGPTGPMGTLHLEP